MKKWENPVIGELGMEETQETMCYCDQGVDLANHGGGGQYPPGFGPGHEHKPPQEGGQCPDTPKPQPPTNPSHS